VRLRTAAVTAATVLALGTLAACGHDQPAPVPTTTAPTTPTVRPTTVRPTTATPTTPTPTDTATTGAPTG
jgi:hypothetical protein